MISNKQITIKKENQFDKGWTLFRPFELEYSRNRHFKELSITNIINLITKSNSINLVLSSICLSSRIVDELKWVNKYVKINIIAQNEEILKRYGFLTFEEETIDDSIDFNYISINGKECGYFIISDGYIEIDNTIENVFFSKENKNMKSGILSDSKCVLFINPDNKKDYSKLIKDAQSKNVKCFYVVNTSSFDRNVFDYTKELKIDLLVSDFTVSGIISVNSDGVIYCSNSITPTLLVNYEIEEISTYIGRCFKSEFMTDIIDTSCMKGDVFSCHRGSICKLNIQQTKIIKLERQIELMKDFVNEKFDYKIVDSHNDYSAEAMECVYEFTLIPPIFTDACKESTIYDPLHRLQTKWKKAQCIDFESIINDYNTFLKSDLGIIKFCNDRKNFTSKLNSKVAKCNYSSYYTMIEDEIQSNKSFKEDLLQILQKMFDMVNQSLSVTKFDKFDNEIEGYRATILEKEELVKNGVEVLSNKRRIEILNKKINDLLELKKHFESSSTSRNDKNLSAFISNCKKLLSVAKQEIERDSIGNIVKPKEETASTKLEMFVDKYLYELNMYLNACDELLDELKRVEIPEDYPVYDFNDRRYIVIDDLKEYDNTLEIQKKFDLYCLARREL